MSLAFDTCRCMGANDFVICAERGSCLRYLAAKEGSDGEYVPYTALLRGSMDVPCNFKNEES